VQRYLSPRCIGLHVTLLVLLPLFAWLTWWQYARATSGNTLSWAYVVLWPAFAAYAVYTWWQLIHDQAAHVPGRPRAAAGTSLWSDGTPAGADVGDGRDDVATGDDPTARPPGWALTGGRKRNVAIAAATPIDSEHGGRGERFTAQTPEEAARMAEYNRYLAELATEDAAEATS
jgi:hypothetical protein